MLYIGYFIILDGQNIKKTSFGNFRFQLPRLETCISRLCPSPVGTPPSKKNTQIG